MRNGWNVTRCCLDTRRVCVVVLNQDLDALSYVSQISTHALNFDQKCNVYYATPYHCEHLISLCAIYILKKLKSRKSATATPRYAAGLSDD